LKKIVINTAGHKSEILIGEKWISFRNYFDHVNGVIITDDNILKIYGEHFKGFPVISLAPGESSKSLKVIEELAEKLLDLGIDRNGFIVGIGGGVVCDIAGFIGSVYMRGIKFGFVSCSLLSQVDASVGGKNGVNLGKVKNIIGNFRQPEFVICDPEMLKTLPEDEYMSGLAELIKNGVIYDADLISLIEKNIGPILKRDPLLLSEIIARSVIIKASVVNDDEMENGIRMILNFGHTFGHAIESQTGMKHGFAVAAGMKIAAEISTLSGILEPYEKDRLISLLNSFKLLTDYKVSYNKISEFVSHDKKRSGETVNFVLIEKTGKAIVKKMQVTELLDYYKLISGRK
jgi:3-dehydroquinate synthase